ncbi:hypothetical protein PDESU_00494 [Pontiella desulfatans]|uniref:Uncharacterized protein n=1 Tax=Pontiella desulfatans TaxID=2750659 RepID=A0A6C2TXG9_PONDE|nr:LPP20 family lipoprotein [Pontiella desulfatans]VGO11946.1 hypothetical protein PDESU_00494 [Pontiella desulfatans]
MKQVVKTAGMVAALVAVGLLAGCKSGKIPKISNKTPYEDMQEAVKKLTDDGIPAEVGVGESRNRQLAITEAKLDARKNLAQQIKVKIENLEKSFAEEVGMGGNTEINALFSSATKSITSQEIAGSVPKVQKFSTSEEGITSAYVLMTIDPNIIDKALAQQATSNRSLYQRFQASKAFEELDKEMKEYEANEKAALADFAN